MLLLSILFLSLNIRFFIGADCEIEISKAGRKHAKCNDRGLLNVPNNLPEDIRSLDLNDNNIQELGPNVFHRYRLIEEISVNNNKLSYIHEQAFIGICLTCLKRLSISRNHLNDSFGLPTNVFKPISSLEVLDISRNINPQINTMDNVYSKIPVHDLPNLRELSIDLVSEPRFEKSFLRLKSLEKITFDYCVAKYLSNRSFENLPESIKELHMTSCLHPINNVESGLFNPIPYLSILNLTDTKMNLIKVLKMLKPFQGKKMDGLFLRGVTKTNDEVILTASDMQYIKTICLRALDISNNNIISLGLDVFDGLKHVKCFEYLLFSGNRFVLNNIGLKFALFISKLENLKALDYSYFPLDFRNPVYLNVEKGIGGDFILKEHAQNSSTGYYPFSFRIPNQLKFFRATHLMAVQSYKEFQFVNSSLEYADISYFDTVYVPNLTFKGSNRMKHLDISGIDSTLTLVENKISNLEKLENLILKEVKFYKAMKIKSSLFDWCQNIKHLELSFNFLTYLKLETFNILSNLRFLNLSNNMFEEIPAVITHLKSLEVLDLTFNHLTTLPESFLNWVDNQIAAKGTFRLYLNKNPFTCSCKTKKFIRWLSETKVTLDEYGNYSCWLLQNSSSNYTKIVDENFHYYFADCDAVMWLHIGISLLASLCAIIFLLVMLYNFRWRIVFFFIRTFRKCAERGLHLSYDYDVYISYSDDGASFVKKLSEKIESEWGFKICIEDRDFLGGETTADQKANSIHKSRHAIFLITPSVVENVWTRFEIERATFEKFVRNLQKVIVIIKCPDETTISIPDEFHLLWKDALIMEWPDSMLSDEVEMAWKKLKLWFF